MSGTTSKALVVFGLRVGQDPKGFKVPWGLSKLQYLVFWVSARYNPPNWASTSEARVASIFDQHTLDFISHSEAQTRRLGARLGEMLEGGETIALQGELGTGKTRWVQGVGQGLHVGQNVTSPTFTLVNEYPGRLILYHIDLYRINQAAEALAFGLEDYLYGDGVCLIEWAEKAAEILPPDRLWITFHYLDDTKRRITMQAAGGRYQKQLDDFKRVVFGARSRG
jgi:tRNA threonylcarbamoyladenosine biosynthesis protein TsaE